MGTFETVTYEQYQRLGAKGEALRTLAAKYYKIAESQVTAGYMVSYAKAISGIHFEPMDKEKYPVLADFADGCTTVINGERIVVYKDDAGNRTNFTLMHELAHIYLDHGGLLSLDLSSSVGSKEEQEADLLASFLMISDQALRLCLDNRIPSDQLMKQYGYSKNGLCCRLVMYLELAIGMSKRMAKQLTYNYVYRSGEIIFQIPMDPWESFWERTVG